MYNLNRPDYKRVHSVHVKCTECTIPTYIEMEDDEVYKFLISQYLLEGGDGFNMTIREDAFYIGGFTLTTLKYICIKHHPRPNTFYSPARRGRGILVAPGLCPASGVTFSCGHKNSKTTGLLVLKF